jgi:predicted aspartyl protease
MKTPFCTLWPFLLLSSFAAPCTATAQIAVPSETAPLVLPMETVNGHLVVVLEDRTLGKLRLMVDTGAEKTMLSARVAEKLKVDRHFTDRFYSFNGFGQGKKARLAGHTRLELRSGERSLAMVEALVLDANNLDVGVQPAPDGVLGWNFFQHLCVRLDSKGKRMTLGAADHCATNEEGFYTPPVEWLPEGLLLPVTVTLANQHAMKLKLHVDTGSDSILLSPRLRSELGLEKKPQGEAKNQGKGVNGSYAWDVAYATAVEADGGHPKVEGKIPLVVPRSGSYSQPSRLFSGKNEALLAHDGVVGNSMLSLFDLIFDPARKKLYERAYSYVPNSTGSAASR